MKISRNFAIVFLFAFLIVILGNIALPFFLGFNVFVVSSLMIFLVALFVILYRGNDSFKIKLIKGLLLIIPIIFLGFVVYSGFNHVSESNSFYDIGGIIDFKSPYLYPFERVSSLKEGVGSRNITSSIVYFDVPAAYSDGNVTVSISFRGHFPRNSSLLIGGKTSPIDYLTNAVYVPSLNYSNASEWKVASTEFNLGDLFIENEVITFSVNIPHLAQSGSKYNIISIDWINITQKK